MSHPVEIDFTDTAEKLNEIEGQLAILLEADGTTFEKVPGSLGKQVARVVESAAWGKLSEGEVIRIAFPAKADADAMLLVKLGRDCDPLAARRAGAALGQSMDDRNMTVIAGDHPEAGNIALGLALRAYGFDAYQTRPAQAGAPSEDATAPVDITGQDAKADAARLAEGGGAAGAALRGNAAPAPRGRVTFVADDPEALAREATGAAAVAEGVFFTRDLVNEPANILTTSDFADRLKAMEALGLEVEILDEDALEKLGMRALLAVGRGSEMPSKVAIMQWKGAEGRPLALVGKGVVFDSGGISIKPAAGMEQMTMDMGGAGVVAGVMRTLALRRAKANVVGLVGLVENMPDGKAQRPGDIVRSMKGDTIEVVNTDAEGRMVLADLLWHAQQAYDPAAIIDLATLTGAVIVALGHDNAGVMSNDDDLAQAFLDAAWNEGEGAWRLPLSPKYDQLLKSRLADMSNSAGRAAGTITAAQFLKRFIRDGQPWAHIDIAGVAMPVGPTDYAPKGASGWGVLTLDRMIRDHWEDGQGSASKKAPKEHVSPVSSLTRVSNRRAAAAASAGGEPASKPGARSKSAKKH